jgi:hypothetical protein
MGDDVEDKVSNILIKFYRACVKIDRRLTLMLTRSSLLRISGLEYKNRGRAAMSAKERGDDASKLENGSQVEVPEFCR